jgi:hypothetical protein
MLRDLRSKEKNRGIRPKRRFAASAQKRRFSAAAQMRSKPSFQSLARASIRSGGGVFRRVGLARFAAWGQASHALRAEAGLPDFCICKILANWGFGGARRLWFFTGQSGFVF